MPNGDRSTPADSTREASGEALARPQPLLVARAMRDRPGSSAEDVGGGLRRAGWSTTAWRLLVRPDVHPWLPGWRHGSASASRVGLATASLLLLAAWLLSGCRGSMVNVPRASLEAPAGSAVCETVKTPKQQLRPTTRDERYALSFDRVPTIPGSRARLVISPRRALEAAVVKRGEALVAVDGFEVAGPTLTLSLEPSGGRWPDEPLIEVQLEVSAPFHVGEALQSYLRAALEDAAVVERRFEQQSSRAAGGATELEARSLDELAKASCQPALLRAAFEKGSAAVEALDAARAALYAQGHDGVAEAEAARKAWTEAREAVAAAAREAGVSAEWPPLEPGESGPLRFAAEHLTQLERIGRELKEPQDREEAARWVAYALAPEGKLEERRKALPALRSIDDAVLRRAWKSVGRGTPLPVPLARGLQPRDWLRSCSALLSRKPGDDDEPAARSPFSLRLATLPKRAVATNLCVGPGGAAPVPDQQAAAAALKEWMSMRTGIVIRSPDQIASAGMRAQCAQLLLCGQPVVDAGPLFFLEVGSSLKPLRDRLREIREATPADLTPAVRTELDAGASSLVCAIAGDRKLPSQIRTVAQYKALVDGARDLFVYAPKDLGCDLSAAKLRGRLRQRWLELVSRAGVEDRLCPSRSGVCPARIAARVQEVFGLGKGRLASPVEQGAQLEEPPPFGFIRPFVEKLRSCKLCEELADVRRGIPGADLSGQECSVEEEEAAAPTSLEIGPPGEVRSVELPGCDLNVAVKLKLRLKLGAGRVVSVVSPLPFRLNGRPVGERRLHAQLGWAYVRTGDIDDQELFGDREAKLLPTGPDQKFYFLSLRTAAY